MYSLAMYQLVAMCDEAAHQASTTPFTVDQAHTVLRHHVASPGEGRPASGRGAAHSGCRRPQRAGAEQATVIGDGHA
jgi:hypothetical protein